MSSDSTILASIWTGLKSLETSELAMIFIPILCYWAYSTMFCVLSLCKITSVELHRIPTNQPMRRPKNPSASTVLWKVRQWVGVMMCMSRYGVEKEGENTASDSKRIFLNKILGQYT